MVTLTRMRNAKLLAGLLSLVIIWLCAACGSKKTTSDNSQAEISVHPEAKYNLPQTASEKPPQSCPDETMAKARQSLAANLQAIYKKEGRLLTVAATRNNCDILELSGPLAEGTYTLDAAERETINCAYCMALYKKTKFKTIRFLGHSMNTEYAIK